MAEEVSDPLIDATRRGRAGTHTDPSYVGPMVVGSVGNPETSCSMPPMPSIIRNYVWRRLLPIFCSLNIEKTESLFLRQPQVGPLFQQHKTLYIQSFVHKQWLWATQPVCLTLGKDAEGVPALWELKPKPRRDKKQKSPVEHITTRRRKWAQSMMQAQRRGLAQTRGDSSGKEISQSSHVL